MSEARNKPRVSIWGFRMRELKISHSYRESRRVGGKLSTVRNCARKRRKIT